MSIFECNSLRKLTFFAIAMVQVLLTGCTVGPDFHRPDPPNISTYNVDPLSDYTVASPGVGGDKQHFILQQEIPARWWELFQNPNLDRLIRKALQNSPTLAAAQATLRQARETYQARSGIEYFPSVDANLSGSRQKVSGTTTGQMGSAGYEFSLFNASVSVSYALDLFGGGRRELEDLQSQIDYQRHQLTASTLALTANIVTAAIRDASLREQLKTTREIIYLQEQQAALVKRHVQLGGAARSDLLAQQAQLAQTRTKLPPLEKDLIRNRNLLAIYSGAFPSAADLPEFDLQEFQLPRDLPLSIPSTLVHQRPDILAAEALLHVATARVGVATANLYPQVTLSAGLGSQSNRVADLFGGGTSFWNLGTGLLQPIFHGGQLTAERRVAVAAYDLAAARYRETVLQAFQNVADVLQALDSDARTLAAMVDADAAASDSLELTQKQYQYGAVSSLALLDAQWRYQQARLGLADARAIRFADTAALFQALGGGWWNRDGDSEQQKNMAIKISPEKVSKGLSGRQQP